jgi:pyridoxine 5-phosphate synthase
LDIQKRIKSQGILFSLFVDPDIKQIEASKEVEADSIEINTGAYSELTSQAKMDEELARIREAAKQAERLGLRVFAGHGLSFDNVKAIAAIQEREELNIGHFLVAQSVYIGIEEAIKIMKQVIKEASP